MGMVKNGCGQFGDGAVKLTISQKWRDGINWFFLHAGTNSEKLNSSWFNDFWMGMVKNGHSLLVHETLKSAGS